MGRRFCSSVQSQFILFCSTVFLLVVLVAAVQGTAVALVAPQVSGGGYHSIALKSDGTVWTWGSNQYGQLGNGTTEDSIVPTKVNELEDVLAIVGGSFHNLALRSDGTVWAWGYNTHGQLGNGTTTSSTVPVKVSDLNNVTAIDAGKYFFTKNISYIYPSHSLALKSDGTVWAWGYNWYGQFGNGTSTKSSAVPVQVSNLSDVTAIAVGGAHNLALKLDGTVWAWGYNWAGQLGNGTTTSSYLPIQVAGLSNIAAIACGYDHSLALKSDGTVWAWGYNVDGQLGIGNTKPSYIPEKISDFSDVVAIKGGGFHSLALKSDGTVWVWGSNSSGQLGNGKSGEANNSTTPIKVSNLSGIAVAAGGLEHSLALKPDGTVWAWGYNGSGQLGNGQGGNNKAEDREPVQTIINVNKTEFPPSDPESLIIAFPEMKLCTGYKKKGDVLGTGYAVVTVSGGDFTIEGVKVTAKTNTAGKKLISISPKEITTGVNGQAKFKIRAKKKNIKGRAMVTFTSGNLEKTLKIVLDKRCFASE